MINYEGYFKNVLMESIDSLFNKELQKKAWENGNYETYADYTEVTMSFLEDCEPVLKDYRKYGLSQKQHDDLQKLCNMINIYDSSQDRPDADEEICKDPEWHKIREYAKVVYNDLKNVKYTPDEKNPK